MKKHWKFGIKILVFIVLAALLVQKVNAILTPKFYTDSIWATTATYEGFYQMPQNSTDVLFFGSSHAASNFNPQVLYENYGIESYNLGCEQQNLLTTYYWLREALKYQSPKAVVIDMYFVFENEPSEPLNSVESCTRKAFDSMKWSKVKWNAVHDICKYDENQDLNSYYFPNIRYHTRWTSLNMNDFLRSGAEDYYELRGYVPLSEKAHNNTYRPFAAGDSDEMADMMPLMQQYLDKIVNLCKTEGIALVLVKTPSTAENIEKYNALCNYAAEKNILFYDFNELSVYNDCGFEFGEDMEDDGHANIWGAEKVSLYTASILHDCFGIGMRRK